nr:LOW QUALITY PROTEIN: ubiquitin carboxyl-terminal hydrolase 1 [Salvelinus alpinus]
MRWISCHTGGKTETAEPDQEETQSSQPQENGGEHRKNPREKVTEEAEEKAKSEQCLGVDLMESLFQGLLVLRTRCLECECHAESREDFQDISVPVQADEHRSPDNSSGCYYSPDPKLELKTLKWAISQFASVERIVGEYLCEICHHYTERSLPFDKTPPEVVTVHLKCFSVLYNALKMDPYAGLSKVNTPLQTPFKCSLEEWCMHLSATGGQHYQLFAVVIHSGVTLSSGRYTTYIRMMDLKDTKVRLPEGDEKQSGEEEECGGKWHGPQPKEEVLDYDDGEVSYSHNAKANSASTTITSKLGAKKASEGVGLLGGQRSLSSYDLGGNKQTANPDKGSGHSSNGGIQEEAEEVLVTGCEGAGGGVSTEQALGSLLQYEGKWMLFDDSEVLFFEEDFLRACSTSTPYLLFYSRVFPPF